MSEQVADMPAIGDEPREARAVDVARSSSSASDAARPADAEAVPVPPARFWTLVREDYRVHGRDWTIPGFRAMFMYRFGVWRMGLPRVIRIPMSLLYRWMHRFVRNRYGIELHYTARIGRRFHIAHQGAIVIHERAIIGDDCTIRQGVTIGSTLEYDLRGPALGNKIDVGAGAMILGKVRIGDNARIGANAVVMMNVPPNALVVAPASRIITPPSRPTTPGGAETRSDQ